MYEHELPASGGFRARRAQRRRQQFGDAAAKHYRDIAALEAAPHEAELYWLPGLENIRRALSHVPAVATARPAAAPAASISATPSRYLKDDARLASVSLSPAAPITVDPTWSAGRRALAHTYNRLGGLMQAVAAQLNVPLSGVLAVWRVESAGVAHTPGRAIIRFENHLLYKSWGRFNAVAYAQHFRHGGYNGQDGRVWENHEFRSSVDAPFQPVHSGQQSSEYSALQLAARLASQDVAAQCISIGGPQILVSNFQQLGYSSALAMYQAFQADERAHVLGFFDFCRHRKAPQPGDLTRYIANGNWSEFARFYNGGGQIAVYSARLQAAFREASTLSGTSGESAFEEDWNDRLAADDTPDYGDAVITVDGYPLIVSAYALRDLIKVARGRVRADKLRNAAGQLTRSAQQIARNATRVGQLRGLRSGRSYPVFQGRRGGRRYNLVTRGRRGRHEIVLITPAQSA